MIAAKQERTLLRPEDYNIILQMAQKFEDPFASPLKIQGGAKGFFCCFENYISFCYRAEVSAILPCHFLRILLS